MLHNSDAVGDRDRQPGTERVGERHARSDAEDVHHSDQTRASQIVPVLKETAQQGKRKDAP